MKHTYSFLAGVASISLTVFLTRSLPGYMFLAGFCVCSLSVVLLGRVIGVGRLARFFSNYANTAGLGSARVDLTTTATKYQSRTRQSREVSGGSVVPRIPIGRTKPVRSSNEIRMRCNSSAAQDGNNRGVVNSVDVLSSVQQDVLSALVNLKVPYSQAEEAIRGARGQSFDELFREALTSVNAGAGKSRRAVA